MCQGWTLVPEGDHCARSNTLCISVLGTGSGKNPLTECRPLTAASKVISAIGLSSFPRKAVLYPTVYKTEMRPRAQSPAIYNGERFSLDDGGQHSTKRMKRNHRLKCFLNPQHRAHSRCSLPGLSERSLLFRAVGVAASIRNSRFSQWLGRSRAKALIHHFYQQLIGVFKNIEVRIHQLITHDFVHGIIFFPEVGVVFVTAGHVMA